eukprot:3174396-Prymnesium_polylepis.2
MLSSEVLQVTSDMSSEICHLTTAVPVRSASLLVALPLAGLACGEARAHLLERVEGNEEPVLVVGLQDRLVQAVLVGRGGLGDDGGKDAVGALH